MTRLMLEIERRFHLIDAYLAELRGDKVEAAECYHRSENLKREMELLEMTL